MRLRVWLKVGRVHPSSSNGTHWQVAPWLGVCHLPFWLDYIVVDVDANDYSYLVLVRGAFYFCLFALF
jgi:hypothetical protein